MLPLTLTAADGRSRKSSWCAWSASRHIDKTLLSSSYLAVFRYCYEQLLTQQLTDSYSTFTFGCLTQRLNFFAAATMLSDCYFFHSYSGP